MSAPEPRPNPVLLHLRGWGCRFGCTFPVLRRRPHDARGQVVRCSRCWRPVVLTVEGAP